jgi:ubiquinone/menaquinone biosynthesis C-methylase UbiE
MTAERRFKGALSEEYRLIRLALPHFEELQSHVASVAAAYHPAEPSPTIRILDLGCGDGVTSDAILSSRRDALVTALDNEEKMVEQASANLREYIQAGRCAVVLHDALDYLKSQPASTFDVVASALTLHNLQRGYRQAVHVEIHRVLKPAGVFVNADKYAQGDEQRFQALQVAVARFFDAIVPLGKVELLRAWVIHNIADQAPDRVMKEEEAIQELTDIGFRGIDVRCRNNMEAVLVARKPD